jgi:hypothetical protein
MTPGDKSKCHVSHAPDLSPDSDSARTTLQRSCPGSYSVHKIAISQAAVRDHLRVLPVPSMFCFVDSRRDLGCDFQHELFKCCTRGGHAASPVGCQFALTHVGRSMSGHPPKGRQVSASSGCPTDESPRPLHEGTMMTRNADFHCTRIAAAKVVERSLVFPCRILRWSSVATRFKRRAYVTQDMFANGHCAGKHLLWSIDLGVLGGS